MNCDQYNDIIDLPHHVSATRPRMSMIDRAAQFSPFAALTGYDAAIKETGGEPCRHGQKATASVGQPC